MSLVVDGTPMGPWVGAKGAGAMFAGGTPDEGDPSSSISLAIIRWTRSITWLHCLSLNGSSTISRVKITGFPRCLLDWNQILI